MSDQSISAADIAALAKAPAKQPGQKQKSHGQVQPQLKDLAQKISWAFCVTPTDATTGGRIYVLSDPPLECDLEPGQSRQATFVSTSLASTAWSERTTDSRYIKPLLTEATNLCLDNDIPLGWFWERVKAFVMLEATRIEEPRAMSFDPEELAYCHMDLGGLEEGPTPAFDEFLSRVDQPEVFKAAVWGVIDPSHTGRQILWIVSPGGDGKSVVLRSLFDGQPFFHSTGKATNQFTASRLQGKFAGIFPDAKNVDLARSELWHAISGRDPLIIERKGEQPFNARNDVKLVVCSNEPPNISNHKRSESSRVLLLELAPLTPAHLEASVFGDAAAFEAALRAEKNAFLFKCREAYGQLHDARTQTIRQDNPTKLGGTLEDEIAEYFLREMVERCAGSAVTVPTLRLEVAKYMTFGMCKHVNEGDVYSAVRSLLTLEFGKAVSTRRGPTKDPVRGWNGVRIRPHPKIGTAPKEVPIVIDAPC